MNSVAGLEFTTCRVTNHSHGPASSGGLVTGSPRGPPMNRAYVTAVVACCPMSAVRQRCACTWLLVANFITPCVLQTTLQHYGMRLRHPCLLSTKCSW